MEEQENCPCGSGVPYADCCAPYLSGAMKAASPEALMRSRYTAYVKVAVDYLFETTHPDHRQDYDHEGTKKWAEQAQWQGLTILDSSGGADDLSGQVEFIARYAEGGAERQHHELGQFEKKDGVWLFTDGKLVQQQPVVSTKVGRNLPCPCGSGKKFKKCCGA